MKALDMFKEQRSSSSSSSSNSHSAYSNSHNANANASNAQAPGVSSAESKPSDAQQASKPLTVDDILNYSKRGKEDKELKDNEASIKLLLSYYTQNKDDTEEPTARKLLKEMASVKTADPSAEDLVKIKKLFKTIGKLVHPDQFAGAPENVQKEAQEVFKFFKNCLDNSGYYKKPEQV